MMAIEILMPALTPTMQEGTLARWLVAPGDHVAQGQVIAEIETDKSILELESLYEGTIGELLADEGTDLAVDAPLATLLAKGESRGSDEQQTRNAADSAAPIARTGAPAENREEQAPTLPTDKKLRASPSARFVARQHDIDLATVSGTGPGGRILGSDVRTKVEETETPGLREGPLPEAPLETTMAARWEQVPLTPMKKSMANRMVASKTTIPHLYCSVEINVQILQEMRREIGRYSLNDLLMLCTARALADTPDMNVAFHDNSIRRFYSVDLAIAVAVPGGLITPVVRNAAAKNLGQLSGEFAELVSRARSGKLRPEEYQEGTFTLSNVGMLGIDQSWPIINPPQAGILGVGAVREVPAIIEGEVRAVSQLLATLAADHRVVDGAIAGDFLRALKHYTENPMRLL